MNVLHVIWGLGGGGKERRLIQLIKGLDAYGFFQSLVAFTDRCDYKGDFEQCCNFYIVRGKGKIERCHQFARFVRETKPDIVHLWQGSPLISLYLPLLKLRHNFKYVAGFVADAIPVKLLSFRTLSNQFTFLFANAIVSNSKAGLVAKKANYKKAHVIFNGFDFNRFKKDNFNREEFRKSLGVTRRFVVTMIARFTPSKDYGMFVELAQIMQNNEDVIFLTVGRGETMDYYIDYCKNNGVENIIFLGFRGDVEEILMSSDFGLLFTNEKIHAEGVSNSIMESMAAGLPVIATRGGGTGEIIETGVSGFIVEPDDANSAAKILKQLIEDEEYRSVIGHNAKKRIVEHFTLEEMTQEYINLYNSFYDK